MTDEKETVEITGARAVLEALAVRAYPDVNRRLHACIVDAALHGSEQRLPSGPNAALRPTGDEGRRCAKAGANMRHPLRGSTNLADRYMTGVAVDLHDVGGGRTPVDMAAMLDASRVSMPFEGVPRGSSKGRADSPAVSVSSSPAHGSE